MNKIRKTRNEIIINLQSGMTVHLACDGERVRGIGRVHLGAFELRQGDVLFTPILQSEAGIAYREFKLKKIKNAGNITVVHLDAIGRPAEIMDGRDAFNFPLAVMPQPERSLIRDSMAWRFESFEETIAGVRYAGMAYQFTLSSRTGKFTCLMERGSWELGRMRKPFYAVAQRSGSTPYEVKVTRTTAYDTSEVFVNKGEETLCWQMMPRYAGSPAFDFQFNADGSLLMYYERPSYIGALQKKEAGQDYIAHFDRHQFALTNQPAPPRKFILANYRPGGVSLAEGRNRWTDAFDVVVPRLRGCYGYRPDPLEPTYSAPIWDSWLRKDPSKLRKMLDWLPHLRKHGVKTLFLAPMYVCDTSFIAGGKKVPMTERQGNICWPWRYEIAPEFGGEKLVKAICGQAHALGLKVLLWIGHWVDDDSPVAHAHPEWVVRGRDGKPWPGGGMSLLSLNRADVRRWFRKQYLGLKSRTGLDGFFFDSYHNFVFAPINHAAADHAPQVDALLRYQTGMQKAGCQFLIETQGIFGVSLNWFQSRKAPWRRKGGFEDFFGQEYTLKNMLPCVNDRWLRDGLVTDDFIYRATACGSPIRVERDIQYPERCDFPDDIYKGMLGRMNHEYNQVSGYMQKRRLLEDDCGVEWSSRHNGATLLFAYRPFSCKSCGKVRDITANTEIPLQRGLFTAKKYHTYLIARR